MSKPLKSVTELEKLEEQAKAKGSVWDGQSVLTMVSQNDDQLELISFFPLQNRWLTLEIPGNTVSLVSSGYGEYQLKNVYDLGRLDDNGGELLRRTIQEMLAVPVHGWSVARDSNLTWWDNWRLSRAKHLIRTKKNRLNNDSQQSIWNQETLNDGSQIYRVNQGLIEELINKNFIDQKVVDEGLSMAILNGSQASGTAAVVGRLIANLGGEVVLIGNRDQLEQSYIMVTSADQINDYTVKVLQRDLGIARIEIGDTMEHRADLVVVLGEDYCRLP